MPVHVIHGSSPTLVSAPSIASISLSSMVTVIGDVSGLLGSPTAWMQVVIGGVEYRTPLFD